MLSGPLLYLYARRPRTVSCQGCEKHDVVYVFDSIWQPEERGSGITGKAF